MYRIRRSRRRLLLGRQVRVEQILRPNDLILRSGRLFVEHRGEGVRCSDLHRGHPLSVAAIAIDAISLVIRVHP